MRKENAHLYFMDPLRGVLMALGVVLHSAQVFNSKKSWLIYSELTTPIAQHIETIVHMFRMPAFFIVAGFFALLTINKYGAKTFLQLRVERVLLPFVVVAATINSLQSWVLTQTGWLSFDLLSYITHGQWISHLWFLFYLLVYSIAVFAFYQLASYVPQWLSLSLPRKISRLPLCGIMLALPAYCLILLAVAKALPVLYAPWLGVFSLYDFLYYFQFFCFGLVLCRHRPLLNGFSNLSVKRIGLLMAVWLLINLSEKSIESEVTRTVMQSYATILLVWIICHVIFAVFKAIGDHPSRLSNLLSSASYTVYLFHQILVIAFGLLLIHLGIGGVTGIALLSAIVFLLAVLIHLYIISKSRVASYLFNGIRNLNTPIFRIPLEHPQSSNERLVKQHH